MNRWTIREWIAVNTGLLAAAIALGALLATSQGLLVEVARPDVVTDVRWWRSLVGIVSQNSRIWLFILAGVVSFGAAGLSALLANGFRFGMDVAALVLSAPTELLFLLPHGVMEFAALTTAAAASQHIGCALFGILVKNPDVRPLGEGLRAFGWSCVLGLAAALIESVSHMLRLA